MKTKWIEFFDKDGERWLRTDGSGTFQIRVDLVEHFLKINPTADLKDFISALTNNNSEFFDIYTEYGTDNETGLDVVCVLGWWTILKTLDGFSPNYAYVAAKRYYDNVVREELDRAEYERLKKKYG